MQQFEDTWLSDDPLRELDDELFGRSHLVDRALEVLARVSAQSESSTIGLVGSWGSGKTTVLNGVTGRLNEPDEATNKTMTRTWRVAEFNPWLFSSPAALYAGFFAAIREALPKDERWKETKANLLKVGQRLAPLGAAAGVFGIDGKGAVEAILGAFEDDVVQTRDKVARALEELKQPILLVVDDLDRLTAEELLHVFKLVRLVGRLPHVYYLLSYDEHTLVDLLSHTDLVAADDRRRALDYLEKIVQVRIDMPLLRPYEVNRIVARAIAFMAEKYKLPLNPAALANLIRRFDDVLSKRMRTPRAIKRVFGQVDAFLGAVGTEVDFGDYLVVTWLRTMEPGVYRLMQERRNLLLNVGGASLRNMDAPKLTPADRREEWLRALRGAHVAEADVEDTLWVLGTLFDSIARVYRSEDPDKKQVSRPEPSSGKVSHPDYFDRFFAFGVPDDDLPDALADAAVIDIDAGRLDTAAVTRVERTFIDQPDLAISKVYRALQEIQLNGSRLIAWLLLRWEGAKRLFDRSRVENLAATALTKLPDEDIVLAVTPLMNSDAGMNFVAAVHHALRQDVYGPRDAVERRAQVANLLRPAVVARYVERYDELLAQVDSPLELSEFASSTVWYWRYHDPSSLREFLSLAMAGKWTTLDVLAWLVPTSTSDGVRWATNRHMSTDHLEELLDLDALKDTVPGWETAPNLEDLEEAEATPELLRIWGVAAARYAFARRTQSATED